MRLGLLGLGLLVACDADRDGDGLTNRQELELGSNPDLADTDSDGLTDGAEVNEHGTDPLESDTDGDGYSDRDEVAEGVDPTDDDDVIYQGGWPYYFDKDDVPNQDRPVWREGRRVRRFSAMTDQFGDAVDLYDFYNEDKPVIVDVSATWCPPCRDIASWLEGQSLQAMSPYDALRDAVNNGDIYWVTIMGEDADRNPATPETAQQWSEAFPNPHVPVLADGSYEHADFLELTGWPTLYLLTPKLKIVHKTGGNYTTFAPAALELLDAQ